MSKLTIYFENVSFTEFVGVRLSSLHKIHFQNTHLSIIEFNNVIDSQLFLSSHYSKEWLLPSRVLNHLGRFVIVYFNVFLTVVEGLKLIILIYQNWEMGKLYLLGYTIIENINNRRTLKYKYNDNNYNNNKTGLIINLKSSW